MASKNACESEVEWRHTLASEARDDDKQSTHQLVQLSLNPIRYN